MPKMSHWNSPEPIDVPAEKAAVYAAQGWARVDAPAAKVSPAVTREAVPTVDAPAETGSAAPAPVKKAAKKPAKKAAPKKS